MNSAHLEGKRSQGDPRSEGATLLRAGMERTWRKPARVACARVGGAVDMLHREAMQGHAGPTAGAGSSGELWSPGGTVRPA